MIARLATTMMTLPAWAHVAVTMAAFGGFSMVKSHLDAAYSASKYPVDYATGQLAFDADRLAAYYGVMQEAGTLSLYWRAQFIDFGFIASMILLGLTLGSLVARVGRSGSLGRKIGLAAVVFAITGASFDIIENLLSFVLLSDPQNLSNAVVFAYSSTAAVKFAALAGFGNSRTSISVIPGHAFR